MSMDINTEKQKILEAGLKDVPFDGWTLATFENAAKKNDMDPAMVMALFPRGERDIMDYFGAWADAKMLDALKGIHIEDLKVRARIRMAVEKRIEILSPYKECVQICFKKLLMPQNARLGAKMTWRSADVIWTWAGDDSTDYNKYTKRGLLSGVIGTTMTYWLQDNSGDNTKTYAFLNARIENVLFVGQNASKVIKPLESVWKNFIVPNIKSRTEKV